MSTLPTLPPKIPGVNQATVSMDTGRLATRDNLDAAGKKFESIFTGMMLGSMRKTKLADGLFESNALTQFRDMQDQQLAKSMADHAPIGLGKAVTEFLSKNAQLPPGDAK